MRFFVHISAAAASYARNTFFMCDMEAPLRRKKIHLNNLYSVEKGNNVRDYSVKSINYFFYLVFSHNHFFHRVLFFWSYVNEAKKFTVLLTDQDYVRGGKKGQNCNDSHLRDESDVVRNSYSVDKKNES